MTNKTNIRITVIGTGYVGLVSGACFAEIGHDVVCVDKDHDKIAKLLDGEMPIYEPSLKDIVIKNNKAGNLNFSTELDLENVDAVFLAVGTPTDEETGNANLKMFFAAAREIKEKQKGKLIIVSKSTVPVGTGKKLKEIFGDEAFVVSNPEFLREGSAVGDFMNPDRVVIGHNSIEAKELMQKLYEPLNCEIFFTSIETSELIKYASNSFLATKVAFINEMSDLCEASGADVTELADGMGMDKRIGREFLNAGPGIGGSCFPKDIRALTAQANKHGVQTLIIDGVIESNERRKLSLAKRIARKVGKGKIAVFGLSFKANTDDIRESAAVDIATYLCDAGLTVNAYDPKADTENLDDRINIYDSAENAAIGCNAVVILTEWKNFKDINYTKLELNNRVIFDLRNLLRSNIPQGFEYFSVGKNIPE